MDTLAILQGRRLRLFLRLVANGLGQAAAAVTAALLIRFIFDHGLNGAATLHSPALWAAAAGLNFTALAGAWLRLGERVDAEELGQDYAYQIRLLLFDRLSSLTPRAVQKRSRGGLLLRFIGDLKALRQWVSLGLARLSVAGVTMLATLLAMAFVNPLLAAVIGAVLGTGAVGAICLGRALRTAVQESRRRQAYLATNVNEKIASIAVVQVFGQTTRERRRIARQGQRLRAAMVNRARVTGGLRAITEGTGAVALAVVLLIGTLEAMRNSATPGTVAAAMTIIGLLVPALRDLGRVYEYWHGYRVALDKIEQFLDTPDVLSHLKQAPAIPKGSGRLEIRELSLTGALDKVNVAAEPGSVVAIVGPNGAGKSSLLQLAARLSDPDQGKVLLDGQDLSRYRLKSVRRAIGMVSPDLPLLRGTLEKNLRYRWRHAPAEEVARVVALCGVDEVIADLPAGAQTRLIEGGLNLSLGQRQRIMLARALLGDPALLLLDEAEANLDAPSRTIIRRVLQHFRGTVLMATHCYESLRQADQIWHFQDGRLVESGPPAQVLNRDGPTSRLFINEWSKAS